LIGLGPAGPAAADALADKAGAFRAALVERHLAPEGFVLYSVDLRAIGEQLRSGAYPDEADTPTFTGLWAATACSRARVEEGAPRAQALEDARAALEGLAFLMRVSGRPGLLVRGARRGPAPAAQRPHHRWFPGGPGLEAYSWRGDVSMDQYANGLLPAVALCAEHFPVLARQLVAQVAGMLLETGMQLIDPDGRRTRFGDLSSRSGYGFNAVARLTGYGVFALAAALDPGDPRWARKRDELRDREGAVRESTRTNLRILGITNYSNDLMAWNLYRALLPLARATSDPAVPDLERGMRRAWDRVRRDRNAYFSLVWCQLEPSGCAPELLAAARDTLERFPTDKRRLAPAPELAELPRAWLPGRKWKRRAREQVPIDLRPASSLEWKSSPYRIDGITAPHTEYTGLDYLMAYWLYRELGSEGRDPELKARSAR
jgi:hypothetical protein